MPQQFTLEHPESGLQMTVYGMGKDITEDQAMAAADQFNKTHQQAPNIGKGGLLVMPHNSSDVRDNPIAPGNLQATGRAGFEEAAGYLRPPLQAFGRMVGQDLTPAPLGPQARETGGNIGADIASSPISSPGNAAMTAAGGVSGLMGKQLAGKAAGAIYGAAETALTPGSLGPDSSLGSTLLQSVGVGIATKAMNYFIPKLTSSIQGIHDEKLRSTYMQEATDFLMSYNEKPQEFVKNPLAYVDRFNKLNSKILSATQQDTLTTIAQTSKANLGPIGQEVSDKVGKISQIFDKISNLPFDKDPWVRQDAAKMFQEAERLAKEVTSSVLATPNAMPTPLSGMAHTLANDPGSRQLLLDRLKQYKAFANIPDTISPQDLGNVLNKKLDILSGPNSSAMSILEGQGGGLRAQYNLGSNTPQVWEGLIKDPTEYLGPLAKARLGQKAADMSNLQAFNASRALNIQDLVGDLQKAYSAGIEQKSLGIVLDAISKGSTFESAMAAAGQQIKYVQGNLDQLSQSVQGKALEYMVAHPTVSTAPIAQWRQSLGDTLGDIGGRSNWTGMRAAGTIGKAAIQTRLLDRPTYPGSQVFNPGAIELLKQELFGGKDH